MLQGTAERHPTPGTCKEVRGTGVIVFMDQGAFVLDQGLVVSGLFSDKSPFTLGRNDDRSFVRRHRQVSQTFCE